MALMSLELEGFRNLRRQRVEFNVSSSQGHSPFRLICLQGDNGSGKSSFLESILLLSRCRSFRTNDLDLLISHGDDQFRVFAQFSGATLEDAFRLGLSKHQGGRIRARLNREEVRKVSDLASRFPMIFLGPESFNLVSGAPRLRRSFLDFGVFHVKPFYQDLWRDWAKTYQQRNAVLRLAKEGRANKDELDCWTKAFATLSEQVTLCRQEYLVELSGLIQGYFGPDSKVHERFIGRSAEEVGFDELIERGVAGQRQAGAGPTRSSDVCSHECVDAPLSTVTAHGLDLATGRSSPSSSEAPAASVRSLSMDERGGGGGGHSPMEPGPERMAESLPGRVASAQDGLAGEEVLSPAAIRQVSEESVENLGVARSAASGSEALFSSIRVGETVGEGMVPSCEEGSRLASALEGLALTFAPGYSLRSSLYEQLKMAESREIKHGYGLIGPQRADLLLTIGGGLQARDILSRGQQKQVIIGLCLCQLRSIRKASASENCLVLIDDLGSELDEDNQSILLRALVDEGVQVIFTMLSEFQSRRLLRQLDPELGGLMQMFHVKHGLLNQIHP